MSKIKELLSKLKQKIRELLVKIGIMTPTELGAEQQLQEIADKINSALKEDSLFGQCEEESHTSDEAAAPTASLYQAVGFYVTDHLDSPEDEEDPYVSSISPPKAAKKKKPAKKKSAKKPKKSNKKRK
jgi:hypothetical protein